MPQVLVRPQVCYAWCGPSLLVVDNRGDSGPDVDPLTGYYFREARFLRTLRFEVNGERPWLCERGDVDTRVLEFLYVHPELTEFGGGGSGQSRSEVTTDAHGIPHRSLDLRARYALGLASLEVTVTVANRSLRRVELELGWAIDADFADIQEAHGGTREQEAEVAALVEGSRAGVTVGADAPDAGGPDVVGADGAANGVAVRYDYRHPRLSYCTRVVARGDGEWNADANRITTRVQLEPQQHAACILRVEAYDPASPLSPADLALRERRWRVWRDGMARVEVPGNRAAQDVIEHNVRDVVSFALLEGQRDEWLALQAGVPLYPALFGRDTLTAGWQAAFLDRGRSLEASLTTLGRMQSDRVDDWHDEEPGRIPYQVRRGPLARLDLNPYAAYYADHASPLMYVISLGHLYAWTGQRATLERHWDTARRILDWARDYGDRDGDGYLEYLTRSSKGAKNQGWKDSGDAIIYEDGTPVPAPLGTCELQGYWFAAQQLMAVMSWARDAKDDARAHWREATALKERFNRDWWLPDDDFAALAMDPDKRLVRAPSSNVGHCIATGIIDDAHLPAVVDRLFAPDMFSGWGVRTLSTSHVSYNPLGYHLGSVWAVEQATIAFGLRRFGFDTRAVELARTMFDLAELYPEHRIPETVGGYARSERAFPGAYPRTNTPQLWNASAFPLLVHTLLGLQPVAPLELLVIDPALPSWLPEVVLHRVRLGGATATLRFWRDADGHSHGEVLEKRGTLRLVRQPPLESLSAGLGDRFGALVDGVMR